MRKGVKEFVKRFENEEPNVNLFIVELIYSNQRFIITNKNNKNHLQIKTEVAIWHKENMVNLGVKYLLPSNWKAFAWIDADIEFESNTWALDTLKILNGCKDVKIMYLRYTRFYKDTVKNCISDTAYFMRNAYLQNDPWNMMFTGSNAIVGSSVYNQKFSPTLAGRGTFHTIIGTANGCQDTIVIQVFNRANIQKDTVFCIADDPFQLSNKEGAGLFFGPGITNAQKGIFNPTIAGVGTHVILFNLPGKCTDTVKIKIGRAHV
jgi:hypothetical protein